MSDELKPCPFCGCEAKVNTLKWNSGYTATALCKNEPNAHYINAWDEDEEKAVERITEAWNTRAAEFPAELDYIEGKSRWYELFGTPEKVADYFATQCMGGDAYTCEICPFTGCDGTLHADTHPTIRAALLEWLEGANE